MWAPNTHAKLRIENVDSEFINAMQRLCAFVANLIELMHSNLSIAMQIKTQ